MTPSLCHVSVGNIPHSTQNNYFNYEIKDDLYVSPVKWVLSKVAVCNGIKADLCPMILWYISVQGFDIPYGKNCPSW